MVVTPETFIKDYIERWEGGLSLDTADTGNWIGTKLIGSKYGVTANALAAHLGVSPNSITAKQMADLSIEEAVTIGKALYYDAPGFDRLPWNRITASIVDFGWGAGPVQAIKIMQRMTGAVDDGKIGSDTIRKYQDWLEASKAEQWAERRNAFYDLIIKQRPANAKFRNGWRNRTAYFEPGSPWWRKWT